MPDDVQFVTAAQLRAMLSVAPSTIEKWRVEGKLPKSILIGRCRRYRLSDVRAWIQEIEAEMTSSATA